MPEARARDGTALFFSDEGEGLPVLALPGLTRNGADFDHVAPHLAVRLVRLDARGRGRSGWAEPATYTVMHEAGDALALLDHLGIARAAVLGTSRGGLVGLALAALAGDRLLGLCLNDVGPVLEPEGLAAIAARIGDPVPERTWEDWARAPKPGFRDVPHARWLAEARARFEETAEGLVPRHDPRLAMAFRATGSPALWPWLDAAAGVPLAVVRGAASDLLGEATVAEMRRRRPDLVAAEVAGRGHVPFLDEPEALRAVGPWLDACRAARPSP